MKKDHPELFEDLNKLTTTYLDCPFGCSGNPHKHLCEENCGKYFKIHHDFISGRFPEQFISNNTLEKIVPNASRTTGYRLVGYNNEQSFLMLEDYKSWKDNKIFWISNSDFEKFFIID